MDSNKEKDACQNTTDGNEKQPNNKDKCESSQNLSINETTLSKTTNEKIYNYSNDSQTSLQATGNEIDQSKKGLKIISIIDNYFASIIDPKIECRKIQEFKLRETYRSEIIDFIKKNDITHLKIAQMAGTFQSYLTWFFNESFYKVPDNATNLIIKWYLRFLSNSTIFDKILKEYKSEKEKARAQIDKYFASIIDPKKELEEIEDLKQTKGEKFLREEIRNFILKHRIYKYEIAEMIGISIFTVNNFFKNTITKENTKCIVYRWYFRYSKHPHIFQQIFYIKDLNVKKNILEVQLINNSDDATSAKDITTREQEKKEINEFMCKDTEVIFKEISSFVRENNLTYQKIADLISKESGISISDYPIRKYLAGNDISSQHKTLIYQWYLRNSKNPASLLASLSDIKTTKAKKQITIENYFSAIIDQKEEDKEIDKLRLVIETKRTEISDFIKMNGLNQQKIEDMSGLGRSCMSYFLNGKNVSSDSKTKISKWYLRYSKHPQIFQQTYFPSSDTCNQTTLTRYIFNNNLVGTNHHEEVNKEIVEEQVLHSQTESSNIDSNVVEKKLSKSGSLSNSLLDITLLYNSQDQKLHTLSVSQTENILDEVVLGSLNRTSSGENEEKTNKLNTIINDLKSVTKENYGPHCSKDDAPSQIEIIEENKINRKRPPLQSIDNRLPKRSSSAIVTDRKCFEGTDKWNKIKKQTSES